MTVDKMTVDYMTVALLTVGKMIVDIISVGKMTIGLYYPLDGITKYKLLCFLTPNKIIF